MMCPTQRNIASGFIEATTMTTLDGVPALGLSRTACRSGKDPPPVHRASDNSSISSLAMTGMGRRTVDSFNLLTDWQWDVLRRLLREHR